MGHTKESYKKLIEKYGDAYLRSGSRKGGLVKVPKGFAKMDKQRLKEVSSMGGKISSRSKKETN